MGDKNMVITEKRTASPAENGNERVFQIIDISGSMDEKDYYPSRLEGAKKAGERFIDVKLGKFPDDEAGIISFRREIYRREAWKVSG